MSLYHEYNVNGTIQYGPRKDPLFKTINKKYKAISPLHARIWILIDMSEKYPSPRWLFAPAVTLAEQNTWSQAERQIEGLKGKLATMTPEEKAEWSQANDNELEQLMRETI